MADLAEAEGRLLRLQAWRLGRSLLLAAVGMGLAAVGAGLLLWAIFHSLAAALGQAPAACLTGLVALLLGGVSVWLAELSAR